MSRRDEILSKVLTITSIPAAAAETARLLQDPESSIQDLVRAIEYDPGLTSNIMRLANSAYYGFPESVCSIKDAIVRLGTNRIFQMVMIWAFSPLAQQHISGYGLHSGGLWEHSIAVAVGAEQLASDLNLRSPEHLFTAGLLHDIGKIVLGSFVEVDISPIMELVIQEKVPFEVAEQQVLGIDHAETGGALLENWNLPSCVAEVSQWHHHPGFFTEGALVVDLVHVADTMCLMGGIGVGVGGSNYCTSPEVVSRLNLTNLTTDTVISRILDKLEEVCGLFSNNGKK